MFIKLLLIFILVPAVEAYVLFEAGKLIGLPLTIALTIVTGIAGAYLARSQGFQVLTDIHQSLNQGHLPARSLTDGALILVGGIFLLTPGFCTDLAGFILLVPFTRSLIIPPFSRWIMKLMDKGAIKIHRG